MERELALIKVKADSARRTEIVQIADIFNANILDAAPNILVLEITGNLEKVNRLLRMLEPFSIMEVQRTGVVAMLRGSDEVASNLPMVTGGKNGQPPAGD